MNDFCRWAGRARTCYNGFRDRCVTNYTIAHYIYLYLWRLRESNPRPSDCEPDVLPTELNPREKPRGCSAQPFGNVNYFLIYEFQKKWDTSRLPLRPSPEGLRFGFTQVLVAGFHPQWQRCKPPKLLSHKQELNQQPAVYDTAVLPVELLWL